MLQMPRTRRAGGSRKGNIRQSVSLMRGLSTFPNNPNPFPNDPRQCLGGLLLTAKPPRTTTPTLGLAHSLQSYCPNAHFTGHPSAWHWLQMGLNSQTPLEIELFSTRFFPKGRLTAGHLATQNQAQLQFPILP